MPRLRSACCGILFVLSSPQTTRETLAPAVEPASSFALTVDVEDYYHVEAFAGCVTREMWPQFPSRVRDNTLRVLELFARHQRRGTFFVLGDVAERYPGLVREILSAGHELACHSYAHAPIWKLTRKQFREDTRRALWTLEQAGGVRVSGYRAPTFSVVARTMWAIEILAEEGFVYDSSVFPIRHDLYGMPAAPRFPFQWKTAGGLTLYEFPMTTVQVAGRNLPAAGGGYLRILPMAYSRWAINRARDGEAPAVLYFHPWELDPLQPRIAAKWSSRIRHYTNLHRMEQRLSSVLATWRFAPMGEVLRAQISCAALPVVEL